MSAEIATGITEEPLETGALIDSACRGCAVLLRPSLQPNDRRERTRLSIRRTPRRSRLRDIVVEFRDRPGVHCIVAWLMALGDW